MKLYSSSKEAFRVYSFKYRDSHGNQVAKVTAWPREGDGYKHCHIITPNSKIALHLNVPAYYIHDDSRDTFSKKELNKFVKWLDSKSPDPRFTWWQYLVIKWNSDKESLKNTKLRIKTRIRPPYEKHMYMSYQECIKSEPSYKNW